MTKSALDTTDQIFSTLRIQYNPWYSRVITVEQLSRLSDGTFLVEGHLISSVFRGEQILNPQKHSAYSALMGITYAELEQGYCRFQ
jgi:hypothetical protein